ncbi:hypothetical protein DM01DRAFT_1331096 [Hesseltinella vesiculosa]|uniref:WWE domain-containing protein n=1 Tax=Hesseltinella vesiculosa TaxID=101127 RepID=A0A1X2GY23_9FUNG|nr:hypothetical protein DM01DRAFT_1331096 [Hesseltinella vesiculosa]
MANNAEWVYAMGSSWNRYDSSTIKQIEYLWMRNASGWIKSKSFHSDFIYIDTNDLSMTYGSYTYVIARRCA